MTPLTYDELAGFSHKDKDRDKFIENLFQNQESVAWKLIISIFQKKNNISNSSW